KVGSLTGTRNLEATINMLITEGKAQVLSKPRLVVVSGKEATFLVGGQVPIKTTTSTASTAATQTSTTFKPYGITMSVTPTIREGKVDVLLNVEISDVDLKTISGDVAFSTNTAQTQLFLNDKETIVLAGLIKKNKTDSVNRIPILGSIPVLGVLFRHTAPDNKDQEIVISLTPTILKNKKADEFKAMLQAPVAPEQKLAAKPAAPKEQSKAAGQSLNATEAAGKSAPAAMPVVKPVVKPMVQPQEAPKPVVKPVELNPQVITKNVAPVDVPAGFAVYAQAVQAKISSAIAYPYEAQENGWQGTVKLGLVLVKNGTVKDVFIKASSGYDIFDQDAMNTAQILAPFPAFPSGMAEEQVSFTIPIVYSLDSFLKNVAKR
ncbi:MAG: TonB family protein, partial [Candidatus Omnitrophica bacterium]|nr:TonB family protein [Candidatus Omnitrophota bacterium]